MHGLRSSNKRCDLSEKARIELGVKCKGVPGVDVETCWSSTFKLILSAYKVRTVINAIINWIPEMFGLIITEAD